MWINLVFLQDVVCFLLHRWISFFYILVFALNPSLALWLHLLNKNILFIKKMLSSLAGCLVWIIDQVWKTWPTNGVNCDSKVSKGRKGCVCSEPVCYFEITKEKGLIKKKVDQKKNKKKKKEKQLKTLAKANKQGKNKFACQIDSLFSFFPFLSLLASGWGRREKVGKKCKKQCDTDRGCFFRPLWKAVVSYTANIVGMNGICAVVVVGFFPSSFSPKPFYNMKGPLTLSPFLLLFLVVIFSYDQIKKW